MHKLRRLVLVMLSLVAIVLIGGVIAAEYVSMRASENMLAARKAWFFARGRQAKDWTDCVRLGVSLRHACLLDSSCGDEATRLFTTDCYAGRYQAAKEDESPGPPFAYQAANQSSGIPGKAIHDRQPGDPGHLSAAEFARQFCEKSLPELPLKLCAQELVFAIEKLDCWGAGP